MIDEIRYPGVKSAYRVHLIGSNVLFATVTVGGLALTTLALFLVLRAMSLASFPAFILSLPAGILAALLVLGLASNWVALFNNDAIRRELAVAIEGSSQEPRRNGVFVGVFEPDKPTFANQIVDTHDDFGLLYVEPDTLLFEGARYGRQIPRDAIAGIGTTTIWQFAYLGSQWVSIHYRDGSRTREFRIEVREERSLRRNRDETIALRNRLAAWAGLSS